MPTTDVRGHSVPLSTEHPSRSTWVLAPLLTVRDPIPVADTTARATKVTDLASAGITPSTSNPIFFFRADAGTGLELEYTTDGSTWQTIPSTGAIEASRAVGSATISVTSLAAGTGTFVAVAFGKTLPGVPKVVVSLSGAPTGSVYLVPRALAATTTGFNLYVYNVGTSAATATNVSVDYIAQA